MKIYNHIPKPAVEQVLRHIKPKNNCSNTTANEQAWSINNGDDKMKHVIKLYCMFTHNIRNTPALDTDCIQLTHDLENASS